MGENREKERQDCKRLVQIRHHQGEAGEEVDEREN